MATERSKENGRTARNKRVVWMGGLGMIISLLLTAWLYWPVLDYDFVMFDDDVNIYTNPNIGEITWARIQWAFTGFDYMPRVMPVAWLTLMAIFQCAGMDATAYHAFNLGMHLMCGVMVFALVDLVLRLSVRMRGEKAAPGWHMFLAWSAASAWMLHPLRSESIAWATGWIYPLVTFFALMAAWLMLRRQESTGLRRRLWWAGGVGAFIVSTLVYPVTLGLPVALLAVEWWLGRGKGREGAIWGGWALIRAHSVFWVISGVVLGFNIWARIVKNQFYPPSPDLEEFTLEHRIMQAGRTIFQYVYRAAWSGETSPVYDLQAPGKLWSWAGGLLLVACVSWGVWLWSRRLKAAGWIAFTIAYLGVVAPFSGFLDYPFQASDRYGYFPGVIIITGLFLALRNRAGAPRRGMMALLAVAWVAGLAAAVPGQLPKWKNSDALFNHIAGYLSGGQGGLSYRTSGAIHRAMSGEFAEAWTRIDELTKAGASPGILANGRERIAKVEELARIPTVIPTARGVVAPDAILSHIYALRDDKEGEYTGARFRYLQALAVDPDFHDARHNFILWLAIKGRPGEALGQYEELISRADGAVSENAVNNLRSVIRQSAEVVGDQATLSALAGK